MNSQSPTPIIEARNITKRYGGVHALLNANLYVNPGECVGIMGDNGAGKSTMVKILSGAQPATSGSIHFDGVQYDSFGSPVEARSIGVETVYQDLSLADDLDVTSNLFMGREEYLVKLGDLSILNRAKMVKRTEELLGEIGVNVPKPGSIVGGLSGGQRQGIAIARAAGWGSKFIIMDEPTAALGLQETEHVHEIIRGLKRRGIAVMIVSHNMDQVMQLCDRVYVFRRGVIVGDVRVAETTPEEIIAMITGAKQLSA